MMRIAAGFLAGLSFVAAGCDRPDDRICSTPSAEITPGDTQACAHKWAYRLARSNESVETVAEAVATACNDVANYAADKASKSDAVQAAGDPEAVRLEGYKGSLAIIKNEAQFRIVQARAGHCDFP